MTRWLVGATSTAFGLLLFAMPLAAQEQQHEGAEFQKRRQAWFDEQRAYPNATVDWEAILRARTLVSQRRSTLGGLSLSVTAAAAANSWVPMGPSGLFGNSFWGSGAQLDAGRVDAIAVSPKASGTMFIATPNGGIWGTSTGGASWTPLTDNQCSLQMGKVRIDPVNPNIVYATTSYSSGAAGCAIMRSLDGGNSWQSYNGNLLFSAYGGFINEFYIDPASAGTTNATTVMFAYGGGGIYLSRNSGGTWTHPLTFGYVTSIVGLPGKPGVLFAGLADYQSQTSSRSGLYRSADNGDTWTQVSNGTIDFSSAGRVELAVSPAQPNSVWLIAGSKVEQFQHIDRWDDVSSQMTQLSASGIQTSASRTNFGQQATYDLVIAVDPSDAQRVYVAGVRAFRSTDGGQTFAPMATEIHCDWHALTFDPNNPRQLYAGTDGGVFVSLDAGDTWLSRNSGLVISMYYPGISQHPKDPLVILGGLQDNGSLLANGTPYYNSVMSGDGGYSAINYKSPGTIWTTCQWSPGGACIQRRTQVTGGFAYMSGSNGILPTDRAVFIPPLVIDPVTPTTLYFGTHRLYQTVNEGVQWTAITGDLTKGSGAIFAIAIAPSDPMTIYVGTTDGNVQVSRDGGKTFTLSSGLPNRAVTHIAVDRTNAARALATFSGSSATHVYLTTNAGVTWTSVSGTLPDMPVNAGVMIDDGPNHFFIGTDAGVFETTDGGVTWVSAPLPNVVVHDLSYNPETKQLVAATYGRGLFRYSLANPLAVLRGDVNRDGKVDAFDALLIQQALVGLQIDNGLTVLPQGDADCNARLEAVDVLVTLRAAVGLTTAGACVGTVR
jgi:photosystem II stability/assembly factor-like uncharacterized protein